MKIFFTGILLCCTALTDAQELTLSTATNMLCSVHHTNPRHRFAFSGKAFLKPDLSWGYEVFADGKLLFRQEEMPGKPKGTGFSCEADALKVAAYIIELLKVPVRPPVAGIEDMKQMRLL